MHFLSNKKIASKTTLKEKTITPDRSKSFTDIPLTNMRKTIAKRLTLSKVTHNLIAIIRPRFNCIPCSQRYRTLMLLWIAGWTMY